MPSIKTHNLAIGITKTVGTFPRDQNKWNIYIHKELMKILYPKPIKQIR